MELVILLGVVGIMMSGILTLFFNVITVNKSAAYYSTAYKSIDSKVEELRGLPFDSLGATNENLSNLPEGNIIVSISDEIDGSPQADIKEVNIKVSWNFRRYTEIREITYIAKGGIKK